MKYLILLEGNTEKAFIELLISKGMFQIDTDEMLDLRPHQKRQIDPALHALVRQLPPDEKVCIIKIGDKLTDKLKIPKDIKDKIESEKKYCTKPEFEILIIIAEGLSDEYKKVKSWIKPKIFAKQNIEYNGQRYSNTQAWINQYFINKDMKSILKTYKERANHLKHELFLYDLVK